MEVILTGRLTAAHASSIQPQKRTKMSPHILTVLPLFIRPAFARFCVTGMAPDEVTFFTRRDRANPQILVVRG